MITKGTPSIILGIVALVFGLLLTATSYSGAGDSGSYFIFYGAIIFGIYSIVRGLLSTGTTKDNNMTAPVGRKPSQTIGINDQTKENFRTSRRGNINDKIYDPYEIIGISITTSDLELKRGYEDLLRDYNLAVENNNPGLEKTELKLFAYKYILKSKKMID